MILCAVLFSSFSLLRSVPVPFRSVPFRSVPFRSVPFRSVPSRSVPFRSCSVPCRCRSVPFRSVPVPSRVDAVPLCDHAMPCCCAGLSLDPAGHSDERRGRQLAGSAGPDSGGEPTAHSGADSLLPDLHLPGYVLLPVTTLIEPKCCTYFVLRLTRCRQLLLHITPRCILIEKPFLKHVRYLLVHIFLLDIAS